MCLIVQLDGGHDVVGVSMAYNYFTIILNLLFALFLECCMVLLFDIIFISVEEFLY